MCWYLLVDELLELVVHLLRDELVRLVDALALCQHHQAANTPRHTQVDLSSTRGHAGGCD